MAKEKTGNAAKAGAKAGANTGTPPKKGSPAFPQTGLSAKRSANFGAMVGDYGVIAESAAAKLYPSNMPAQPVIAPRGAPKRGIASFGIDPPRPIPQPTVRDSGAAGGSAPSVVANPYSSTSGAAAALFGDGGPMYGSTAPAPSPATMPSYNPPTSISSAPSFSGTATEPPPAPAFAEPTYVPPAEPTNTAPTAVNPQGMTLAGVRSAIMWNSGGVAPLDNSAEFRARAAQLGYTSWEGSDGPVVMSTSGGGIMPVYVAPKP